MKIRNWSLCIYKATRLISRIKLIITKVSIITYLSILYKIHKILYIYQYITTFHLNQLETFSIPEMYISMLTTLSLTIYKQKQGKFVTTPRMFWHMDDGIRTTQNTNVCRVKQQLKPKASLVQRQYVSVTYFKQNF